MIILHVVEPFAAGITTFVRQITQNLPDDKHIILHGERKEVMDPEAVKATFSSENVVFIRWKYAQREINPISDLLAFGHLMKLFKNLKFDIVHLHSSKAGFLGRIACRIHRFDRVIYSPNGGSFLRTDISSWKRNLFIRLERFANRFSGVVICSCSTELYAFTKVGIVAKFIDNGTEITDLEEIKPEGKFRVLLCGNITFQKNPKLFNDLALRFSDDEHIEFVWLGDGLDRGLLTSSNIRITGWMSSKDVKKWLRTADVYLSCSLWEGLPYAVLEAMNQGKPLLLTKCVGNVELVKEGYNGYYFQNDHEGAYFINQFKNDPELLKLFSQNSRKYCVSRFNATDSIRKHKGEYQHLMEICS